MAIVSASITVGGIGETLQASVLAKLEQDFILSSPSQAVSLSSNEFYAWHNYLSQALAISLLDNSLNNSLGYYQDYLSTFARFFGASAKQTVTHIHIKKDELPELTPLINNSAESLIIALLLRVYLYESNSLLSKITSEIWKVEFIRVGVQAYIRHILLIKLYLPLLYSVRDEAKDFGVVVQPNDFKN